MSFSHLGRRQHCVSAVRRLCSFTDYVLVTLNVDDDVEKKKRIRRGSLLPERLLEQQKKGARAQCGENIIIVKMRGLVRCGTISL